MFMNQDNYNFINSIEPFMRFPEYTEGKWRYTCCCR